MTVELQGKPHRADPATLADTNRALFDRMLKRCWSFVAPEHQEAFLALAVEIEPLVLDNCRACAAARAPTAPLTLAAPDARPATDSRRQRHLLRLVVGRFSPLFLMDNALYPRSIVEGIDVYLKRSLGEVAYQQLNTECDEVLAQVSAGSDDEMWNGIEGDTALRRWADTIFIRMLLRFVNFEYARNHMIRVIDGTTMARSGFSFETWHFTVLFDALFGDLYRSLTFDDQRHHWEVLFGDGTVEGLEYIFERFVSESLGSLQRYQKVSGYQPKFAMYR